MSEKTWCVQCDLPTKTKNGRCAKCSEIKEEEQVDETQL